MKKFLFFILFMSSFNFYFAQDPFFTNTNQSLVYLNPSFSGSNGFIRNQTVYRNQWPNISGPAYVTYGNAFDAYIKPIKGGVSLSAVMDDQGNGTLKMTFLNFAYAQYFSLLNNKVKVIPSVQFGYFRETLDKTKLNFGDGINSRYNMVWNDQSSSVVPVVNKENFNFSSGLLITYNDFILGVSAFNANQPDIGLVGFYKLPARTCINASYNMAYGAQTMINFSGVSNFQMGLSTPQFKTTLVYREFVFGLGYFYSQGKTNLNHYYGTKINFYDHGFLANIGLHFKRININYSYDNTVIKNSEFGTGKSSHEISLSLNFKSKKDTIPKFGMEYW